MNTLHATRILVADDHEVVRKGLCAFIGASWVARMR